MARYKKEGVFVDGQGAIIQSATINVYLAGTTTAASIYAASSGGAAVNSVTSDATTGKFEFWIDDTDYDNEQLFKIVLSKTGFESLTYDDIIVFPIARLVLDANTNNLIDGRTYPREVTLGATRMEHTPAVAGTRALHIDVKPTGFDDTNCIVARLDLEGGSESIRPKCLNLNADISGATNAHVNLIEAAKTGDKDASMVVDALDIRPGVRPIHHHAGTIGAVDTAFKYDASGTSYTNVTTEFGSGASDTTIFDEDNDVIYLGHASKFDTIEVILATVASNPGVKPTFEYSQGASAWNSLPVSDDTNGFRENGNIFYATPSDWATDTVNAVASKYWVRITRTTNSLSTIPIEDTIKIAASTEYTWGESGDLVVKSLTTTDALVLTTPQINDTSADHQYIFAVSELSADRTVTLPLLTGNDEFVFKDFIQTLTNKTLGTGTNINLGSDANGDIYYRTGGNFSRLPKGTDGQVLQLSSGLPAWTSAIKTSVSFSVHNNGTGTSLGAATWTQITLGTEEFDTNNDFASSTFTPTIAGKYQLNGAVQCLIPSAESFSVGIYKNGALYKRATIYNAAGGAQTYGLTVSAVVDANGTTDNFELWAFKGGGAQTTSGAATDTYFTGSILP